MVVVAVWLWRDCGVVVAWLCGECAGTGRKLVVLVLLLPHGCLATTTHTNKIRTHEQDQYDVYIWGREAIYYMVHHHQEKGFGSFGDTAATVGASTLDNPICGGLLG